MRRLFKEGKTDLNTGYWINYSFVFFLLSTQIIFPQIPVNGFCYFKSFEIPQGYEHLIQSDPGENKLSDFILYSPDKKELIFLTAENGQIAAYKTTKAKTTYEISTMINITVNASPTDQFVFTSRKNRLMGIIDITVPATINKFSKLEFDSYPENISDADINNDGVNEYLLSGSGFDGISAIFRDSDRFGEKKIISGISYGRAQFLDLSNDDSPDFIAYNLVNRSLEFFYNDSEGNFDLVRSIETGEIFSNILTPDINTDGYDDIIYAEQSGLKIIYGDAESKYSTRTFIRTGYLPQLIVTGDFNNDEISDIAYIDKMQGVLSVLFGMGEDKFYNEIFYTKKSGLSDLKVFNVNSNHGLALLSKDGSFYIFSDFNHSGFNSDINLAPAISPVTIKTFNKGNDEIKDLCFIEQESNSLMLLINDLYSIPVIFYSIPLSDSYSEIKTDESFENEKTFYCYSKGSNLIELVRINFDNNLIQRKQLYSPGPLEDLRIQRADSNLVEVYIVYNKINKLYLGKFEHRDLSITFKEYPAIDLYSVKAELLLADEPIIYYWKEISDTLHFLKAEIKTRPYHYFEFTSFPKSAVEKIFTVAGLSSNHNPFLFSILASRDNNTAIVADGSGFNILLPFSGEFNFKVENERQLFLENNDLNNFNDLVIYFLEKKSLSRIDLSLKEKYFKLTHILDVENVFDFIVDSMDSRNNHFIYSNKKEGCISIIQLD